MKRSARGQDLPAVVSPDRVVLAYVGLDGERRSTLLRFSLDAPTTHGRYCTRGFFPEARGNDRS